MKIAIVTHGLDVGGGVPNVARWLASGLQVRGHVVDLHDLATSRSDTASRRLVDPSTWTGYPRAEERHLPDVSGTTFWRWGAPLAELEPMRYRSRRALTEVLNSYDLVQVVSGAPSWANVVADVEVPRVLQVATVTKWERASRYREFSTPKRAFLRSMESTIHRLDLAGVGAVDHVIVENAVMQSWVMGSGQPRVSLVPPGIDTEHFVPAGSWSANGAIVAVGRLGESRKGWSRVLLAYDRLARGNSSAPPLTLVGKGALAREDAVLLHGLCSKDAITIVADASPCELLKALQRASVFVQGSHEEGLGIAGLEAMACGLPMVATDTAGTREYLHDKVNGVLVSQSHAVTGLASGIDRVLAGDGAAMSVAARATVVDHFSSDVSLDRFLAVYELVLR